MLRKWHRLLTKGKIATPSHANKGEQRIFLICIRFGPCEVRRLNLADLLKLRQCKHRFKQSKQYFKPLLSNYDVYQNLNILTFFIGLHLNCIFNGLRLVVHFHFIRRLVFFCFSWTVLNKKMKHSRSTLTVAPFFFLPANRILCFPSP